MKPGINSNIIRAKKGKANIRPIRHTIFGQYSSNTAHFGQILAQPFLANIWPISGQYTLYWPNNSRCEFASKSSVDEGGFVCFVGAQDENRDFLLEAERLFLELAVNRVWEVRELLGERRRTVMSGVDVSPGQT